MEDFIIIPVILVVLHGRRISSLMIREKFSVERAAIVVGILILIVHIEQQQ